MYMMYGMHNAGGYSASREPSPLLDLSGGRDKPIVVADLKVSTWVDHESITVSGRIHRVEAASPRRGPLDDFLCPAIPAPELELRIELAALLKDCETASENDVIDPPTNDLAISGGRLHRMCFYLLNRKAKNPNLQGRIEVSRCPSPVAGHHSWQIIANERSIIFVRVTCTQVMRNCSKHFLGHPLIQPNVEASFDARDGMTIDDRV